MAGPKGFLITPRHSCDRRPVHERVQDWNEVYDGQSLLPIINAQAGRCMDCGIPFCHSSCPLGNLIPEWNTLVSRDDWDVASERLHATNNFPEFTGRLCPAPCESGCVLAINADPVTIKDIEMSIADHAWQHGSVQPLLPQRLSGKTVAIVGSGPAGLACAQQLTRTGHTVVVYEREDRIGGLLRYGIPEFKMEKYHLDRRLEQMRAEGTTFRTHTTVGTDVDAAELRARYDAMVIAVGAHAWRDLPLPGRELAGIHQAMEYLPLANRVQEGDLVESPVTAEGKHVVIIGGGDTAADCLGTVLRQRAVSVAQLDINPRPGDERSPYEPWPVHPRIHRVSAAHEEARELARQAHDGTVSGLPLPKDPGKPEDVRAFSASTVRFEGDAEGHVRMLHLADAAPGTRQPISGTERWLPADLVLLALGFSGPEQDGGIISGLGLKLDERGTFERDENFATDTPGVFVAGDAGRGQSLIVWAIAEGRSAAAAVDRYLTGTTQLPTSIAATDRPLTA
ncbi:MAG: glutamate synthase subunit beta [Streptomycetaceae bacterium]|nr:glutamate synthase subunit beta [Streptomycetaceae bacterium]